MTMQCVVSTTPPHDFNPTVHVAGCYVECDGKFLFLQRPDTPKYSRCWGVPAGKLDSGETPLAGGVRELFEETGITICSAAVRECGTLYMRLPHLDYVYYLLGMHLEKQPPVVLNDEHIDMRWVSTDEALKLNLMPGAAEAFVHYRGLFK